MNSSHARWLSSLAPFLFHRSFSISFGLVPMTDTAIVSSGNDLENTVALEEGNGFPACGAGRCNGLIIPTTRRTRPAPAPPRATHRAIAIEA